MNQYLLITINILIFYFFVLLILFYHFFNRVDNIKKKTHHENKNITSKFDFLNKCKTGDILLVSYDCKIIKYFTSSNWSHTSMIIKTNDIDYIKPNVLNYEKSKCGIYLLECGSYSTKKYCGISLIPIEIWLKMNKRFDVSWIPSKIYFDEYELFYQYKKYKKINFYGTIPELMKTLRRDKYKDKKYKSFYCSQFIAKVLQDLNKIPKILLPQSFCPEDFYKRRFSYIKDIYYKPYLIHF